MTRFELEMMVLGSDIYSNVYWTNNENNKIEAQDQANVPSRKMINLLRLFQISQFVAHYLNENCLDNPQNKEICTTIPPLTIFA